MNDSNDVQPAESSTSEAVQERRTLHERFVGRLSVNRALTSKMVSYRGNYNAPGFRWMKYKEAFSRELIEQLIADVQPRSVLDPFSGIGTTPLIAAGRGLRATGIEIIPVGVLVGEAIALAANGLQQSSFTEAAANFLKQLNSDKKPSSEYAYPHVRITEAAFPAETESALAKAREFISSMNDPAVRTMLNLNQSQGGMCICRVLGIGAGVSRECFGL